MTAQNDSLGFRVWPEGPLYPMYPCAGEVHVWRVRLKPFRAHAERWRTLLSADENARADRFHFQRDRETWLITRGVLRTLLGRYLGLPGSTLEFVYNPSGKPALHSRFLSRDLSLNVSHSGDCSLLAFASGLDVGVDIECWKALRDIDQLSRSIFSADELAVFQCLSLDLRRGAFFAAWTRKEALLKALGTGLSLSPKLIEVTFAPGEDAHFRKGPALLAPFGRWSLRSLDVAELYSAAVAASAAEIRLSLSSYPESDGVA